MTDQRSLSPDEEIEQEMQRFQAEIRKLCKLLESIPEYTERIEEFLVNTQSDTLYDYFVSRNIRDIFSEEILDVYDGPFTDLLIDLLQKVEKLFPHPTKDRIERFGLNYIEAEMTNILFAVRFQFLLFALTPSGRIEDIIELYKIIIRDYILAQYSIMDIEVPPSVSNRLSEKQIADIHLDVKDLAMEILRIDMRADYTPSTDTLSYYGLPEERAFYAQLLDAFPNNFEEVIARQILGLKNNDRKNFS